MLVKKPEDVKSSEITDKNLYLNRRLFMRGAVLAATATATGLLYRSLNPPPVETPKGSKINIAGGANDQQALSKGYRTEDKLTPLEDITNYNNFYEFSTGKSSVARVASSFVTRPWTV